jgi:glycosyltransferase involved in cell wall biosynthesis
MIYNKKIVVFIPAYNAEKTIKETLDNINISAEAINTLFDVFIVDDCSTDETFDFAISLEYNFLTLNVIRNVKNLGERGTINVFFEELKNNYDWCLLIHADDVPYENWLGEMLKIIKDCDQENIFTIWSSFDDYYPETNIIITGDSEGSIVCNQRNIEDAIFYITKFTSSFHVSGCAINLKLYPNIKFDSSLPQYGDTDFFVAGILYGYNDIYIRKCLTKYRMSDSSVTSISFRTNRDINEVIYLISKYKYILKKENISVMKRKINIIVIKRFIKAAMRFNLSFIINCSKLLYKINLNG